MGLLDDAIREHLDLKRKHGAGDEELRRQETEALGPARRDFTADAANAEPAAAAPAEAAPTAAPEPAEPAGWLDDEPGGAPFDAAAEAPPPAPPKVPEPAAEATELDLEEEPLPAPDPAPVEEPPEHEPERRLSQTPTEGFDALSRDDEAEEGGDEDVLEETPDFLQDTPEHDRLWFEQKPPRDFDFDD
jgi:hypothetical protein